MGTITLIFWLYAGQYRLGGAMGVTSASVGGFTSMQACDAALAAIKTKASATGVCVSLNQ